MSNCPVGGGCHRIVTRMRMTKKINQKTKQLEGREWLKQANMDTIFKNRKQDLANMGAGGSILNGFNFQRVGKKIGMKST